MGMDDIAQAAQWPIAAAAAGLEAASSGMVRELLRFRVATTLERVRLQGLAEALDRMPHGGWFQEQHPSGTIRTVWIAPPPGTPLGKGSGS